MDREVVTDPIGAHQIAPVIALVETDRLELLDLAMRRPMVLADRVPARERVDERVERAVDREMRGQPDRDRRGRVVAAPARDLEHAAQQRDRAALVQLRAPRRRPRRCADRVAHDLLDVAVEVREIDEHRAEPSRVFTAHDSTPHTRVEPRRSERLAQRGQMNRFGGHRVISGGMPATAATALRVDKR